MKLIRNLNRYFRDAAKSVVRNFSLSLASISCIAITLIVVAISMIISNNVDNASEEIMTSTTVVIWIEKSATPDDIKTLEQQIRKIGNVSSLVFKSKQEFAEDLKNQEDKFAPTINSWTDETNPLMDSYKLKVKDIEIIKDTVNQIKGLDNVNSVDYGQTIVDQVVTVFKAIESRKEEKVIITHYRFKPKVFVDSNIMRGSTHYIFVMGYFFVNSLLFIFE